MKRLLIIVSFLFVAVIGSYSDERHTVKLNDGHTEETLDLTWCNIKVTKGGADNGANSKVAVEIENRDETNTIILFGHAYPEKELKRLPTSIVFAKGFPGTKGERKLDTFSGVQDIIVIKPEKKSTLPEIRVKRGEAQLCRLPLYVAVEKKKNFFSFITGRKKMVLMDSRIFEIVIEVGDPRDADYDRLKQAFESLQEDISNQTFCNNKQHRPTLSNQKRPYEQRKEDIIKEIQNIKKKHDWYDSNPEYQPYKELINDLKKLPYKEVDCGIHKPIPDSHRCKYCNLSLQQIYHKLDDYYKKIYISNNRQATKNSVMDDVNLLYKCCTDSRCSKHASSWNSSEYKSKITDRYNRISNF